MLPSTLSSSFIFNFPSDFLTPEVQNDYNGFIEYFHLPYENIIDFLNSTIKSVTCPGLTIDVNMQHILRGKEIRYKPAKPVQDAITTHEIEITFRSVLGDSNWLLCFDIFQKHYLEDSLYIQPFVVTALDPFRNGMYALKFHQLIAINLSENKFDYSVQKVNAKEFTMTFTFNYIELEFLLNKSKILDLGNKHVLGNSLPIVPNILRRG